MKHVIDPQQVPFRLTGARVAVLGYGPSATQHALGLRDAGNDVSVGMRSGGMSWVRARKDGFPARAACTVVEGTSVVVVLVPDDEQASVYWHADRAERRAGRAPRLRPRSRPRDEGLRAARHRRRVRRRTREGLSRRGPRRRDRQGARARHLVRARGVRDERDHRHDDHRSRGRRRARSARDRGPGALRRSAPRWRAPPPARATRTHRRRHASRTTKGSASSSKNARRAPARTRRTNAALQSLSSPATGRGEACHERPCQAPPHRARRSSGRRCTARASRSCSAIRAARSCRPTTRCSTAPIRHVLVRHEQGAAHMADGYARASGKVGVAIATSGPGATNLVTGIATAMLDSVPMVCITGQVSLEGHRERRVPGDGHHRRHAADHEAQLPRHRASTTSLRPSARPSTSRASGRPGPVLVDITKDAQQATTEVDWSDAPVRLPGYRPEHRARAE